MAVLVLFFAVSCGSSGNNGNKDNTDTGETVTDSDTADSGQSDSTPEQPDDADSADDSDTSDPTDDADPADDTDSADSQCKVSETNNKLSLSDWTCSSCSEGCTEGANGECNCSYKYYFEDGRYSELGDAGWLWSSSVVSGYSHLAWGVNFYYAKLYYESKSNSSNVYVRCVRQD